MPQRRDRQRQSPMIFGLSPKPIRQPPFQQFECRPRLVTVQPCRPIRMDQVILVLVVRREVQISPAERSDGPGILHGCKELPLRAQSHRFQNRPPVAKSLVHRRSCSPRLAGHRAHRQPAVALASPLSVRGIDNVPLHFRIRMTRHLALPLWLLVTLVREV